MANGNADEVARRVVDGKLFVTLIHTGTPLPARRVFSLGVPSSSSGLLELYEGDESVRVEKTERPKDEDDDDDDDDDLDDDDLDEEDKLVEVRTVVTKPAKHVGTAVVAGNDAQGDQARIELRVSAEGKLNVLVGPSKRVALEA